MKSEVAISETVEPLSSLCGPSLFPRTIRALTSTHEPLLSEPEDLDSIHYLIKSMSVSSSPEKLLEEANAIVDGGSELLNSNFAVFTMSMGIDDTGPARENEKPRERRPALGHKRVRFSLKPNSCQPSEILEPSFNIDEQDPEEYFKAFERLENAKKEIQRQKGGSITAFNEINLSQNTRCRRPSLSRKSVTYKHLYPVVSSEIEDTFIPFQMSENEDTVVPSQDPLELSVPSSPDCELLQRTDDSSGYSPNIDVAGSVSKTDDKVDTILDELLNRDIDDLDAHLLQEKLQFKPIELGTLTLPNDPGIGKADFTNRRKEPKPRRTSLEVQNLVKWASKETPISHKQMEASSSLASPTPPKSPFASLSLVSKRILQSNPSRDPFSPLNIDLQTPRNRSYVDQVDNNLDDVNGPKRFNFTVTEDRIKKLKISNMASEKVIKQRSDSNRALEKVILGGSDKVISGSSNSLPDQSLTEDGRSSKNIGNNNLMDGTSLENIGSSDLMDGPDIMKENVEDGPREIVSSLKEHDGADCSAKSASASNGHGSRQMETDAEDMPSEALPAQLDINSKESTIPENLNVDQMVFDESDLNTTKECPIDMVPTVQKSNSKQELKKPTPKGAQPKRKRSPVGRRERKILSRRPSIAESGTSFDAAGVRRSRRVKSRPLEYWKGERFLYGRINGGMKLIGLRYISPSKGEGEMKVKPYVSNEYNELLEIAAKH